MQYEPERITVERESVVIEWTDGESTAISGSRLRDACPCADCRERTVATPVIQLGDRAMIINAQLVGGYAVSFTFGGPKKRFFGARKNMDVSFTFGDNHHDGIYPYGQLRRLGEASSP